MKLLFILFALFLAGCSTTLSLYPVEGPMARIRPLPVIKGTAEGIIDNTGSISLTLPDGEFCQGQWSSRAPSTSGDPGVQVTVNTGTQSGDKGEAVLACNRGTVIQIEFYSGSNSANGTGIAKDNKGNVFKVLF